MPSTVQEKYNAFRKAVFVFDNRHITLGIFGTAVLLIAAGLMAYSTEAFAQGLCDPREKDCWYPGEGWEQGDWFRYEMCTFELRQCEQTYQFSFWLENETKDGNHVKVLVQRPGERPLVGDMKTGTWTPTELTSDKHLNKYINGYETSLNWLSQLVTRDHPGPFNSPTWGESAAIGGSDVTPKGMEKIDIAAGSMEVLRLHWKFTGQNNILLKPDLPFPVKARVNLPDPSGGTSLLYKYELLDYGNSKEMPEFFEVKNPITEEVLTKGCPDPDTLDELEKNMRAPANTDSMIINWGWTPEQPVEGCETRINIDFQRRGASGDITSAGFQFHSDLHFDVVRIGEDGKVQWSLARQETGDRALFNSPGQYNDRFIMKDVSPGKHTFAIVVYGTGPKGEKPDPSLNGLVKFDMRIKPNPALEGETNSDASKKKGLEIPTWIHNNAKWWSEGKINDDNFVKGIQYLIKNDIMNIPQEEIKQKKETKNTEKIPRWIQQNAGWWAKGKISDQDFVKGIKWLITNRIIKV